MLTLLKSATTTSLHSSPPTAPSLPLCNAEIFPASTVEALFATDSQEFEGLKFLFSPRLSQRQTVWSFDLFYGAFSFPMNPLATNSVSLR